MSTVTIHTTVYDPAPLRELDFSELRKRYTGMHDNDSYDLFMLLNTIPDVCSTHSAYIGSTCVENCYQLIHRLPSDMPLHDCRTAIDYITEHPIHMSAEFPCITDKNRELFSLITQYCALVATSRTLVAHGKSWEPAVIMRVTDGTVKHVNVSSYQAGDLHDGFFNGSLDNICARLKKHIDNITPALMHGIPQGNPLVTWMAEKDADHRSDREEQDTYENFLQCHGELFEEGFFPHGAWLLSAIDDREIAIDGENFICEDCSPIIESTGGIGGGILNLREYAVIHAGTNDDTV